MARKYDKEKDSVWGLTDAQSNYIRSAQENGSIQRQINEVVKTFHKVNEKE